MRKSISLLLVLFVLSGTPAYAFEWRQMGGDPVGDQPISIVVSKLSLPSSVADLAAWSFANGNPHAVSIQPSSHYTQMTFGRPLRVESDVYCRWNESHWADRIQVDYQGIRYTIDRFIECRNVAWFSEPTPYIPEPEPEPAYISSDSFATAPVIAPTQMYLSYTDTFIQPQVLSFTITSQLDFPYWLWDECCPATTEGKNPYGPAPEDPPVPPPPSDLFEPYIPAPPAEPAIP
jgi:hypothetical protein